MNLKVIGKKGEDLATAFITQAGGIVLDRNFYFKGGEIDIVAKEKWFNEDYLCFIEVKYRDNCKMGYPEEAVTLSKQKKIIKGAKAYMNLHKLSYNTPCRFDVISILNNEVKWIKNAFTM